MASYSENFDKNFKILTILGLWDLRIHNTFKNWFYYCYQIFSLLFLILFIILEYIDLYFVRHDLEKFNFNLCATVTTTATIMKTMRALQKFPDINGFRQDFNRDSEKDKDYKKIILKASLEMKYLINFFYSLTFILIVIWSLTPLLDYKSGDWKLMYRQWYPFDVQQFLNYVIAYVYQVISLIIIASNVVASDLVVWCFMISMIAEYEILETDIRKINEVYEKHVETCVKDEMVLRIIKDVVAHHQRIIL